MRNHRIEDTVHLLVTLTDRKSADRVAVAVHLRDRIRMRDPDILEGSALIDAEQKLMLVDGVRVSVQLCHFFSGSVPASERYGHRMP